MFKKQANTEKEYHIKRKELPVCCPKPDMHHWNSHPRVYMPLPEQKEAKCPYCGAKFVLDD